MKCLIIAAGQGSRIREKGASKPLVPLLGLPLIEWVANAAREAGITGLVVVTGYNRDHLEPFLADLSHRLSLPVEIVFNQDWELANGISVLKAREVIDEPFLLTMSDHVIDAAIMRELIEKSSPAAAVTLAVDRDLGNPLVDIDDVTRVETGEGRIVSIGKNIANFDCYDTGVFLATPALFGAIEESIEKTGDSSLSGGMRLLAARGAARVLDVTGHFWIDVDDPAAYARAEASLAMPRLAKA
jgi:1L-myo-inositol 1-phosphate cytidylyltransferase